MKYSPTDTEFFGFDTNINIWDLKKQTNDNDISAKTHDIHKQA